MYAVIETGGKQYRVEVGTELEVELLDAVPGDSIRLERILLVADGETAEIGRPVVANASVAAQVVRRERGPKLISFKYRPKARRRVKKGHRQELMVLRISDIVLDGKSAAKEVEQADEARRTERQKLEDAARRQAEQDAALAAKLAADKPAKTETKSDKSEKSDSKTTAKRSTAKADTSDSGDGKKTSASKTKSDAPAKASRARKSDEG